MVELGRRTGVGPLAASRVAKIRQGLEEVKARAAGRPKRSVLFIVGRTPGTINDLIVVGRGSFLNESIVAQEGGGGYSEWPLPAKRISPGSRTGSLEKSGTVNRDRYPWGFQEVPSGACDSPRFFTASSLPRPRHYRLVVGPLGEPVD
jgi:hypothetical protein